VFIPVFRHNHRTWTPHAAADRTGEIMKTKRIAMALAGMVGTMAQAAPPGLLAPVAVEDLPARRVAYVEQVGNFQQNPGIYDVLLQKLLDWARPPGSGISLAKTCSPASIRTFLPPRLRTSNAYGSVSRSPPTPHRGGIQV
jgi:hypothetical protein